MKAMLLRKPAAVDTAPLVLADVPAPEPGPDEILVRVKACGVCRTDLHTVTGEIAANLPIIPGHEIVGTDTATGDRVGIPWLHRTCGKCDYCRSDRENLCDVARFTGFHVNGGYAEYAVAPRAYTVPVPASCDDVHAAPLLCAGIIGYRALRLSGVQPRQPLGLYGFGAAAHLALQVAAHWGCEVFVATRSPDHQQLARQLGAAWVGRAEEMPSAALAAAILFAPAGQLVPQALRALRRGGTLALGGIYMSPLPGLPYEQLYHERVLRSVANATRADARQFMELAGSIPLKTTVETFPLEKANDALAALHASRLRAAAVLVV